jgi:hypothetical protein
MNNRRAKLARKAGRKQVFLFLEAVKDLPLWARIRLALQIVKGKKR